MIKTYHRNILFAEGNAKLEDSEFAILGVPYDRSSSFRTGQRTGPNAIRESSWNFEPYMFEHSIDLRSIGIHDMGNIDECGDAESMIDAVEKDVRTLLCRGIFPILLGGEHSITIGGIRGVTRPSGLPPEAKEKVFGRREIPPDENIGAVVIDAHFDLRDSYLDDRYSHACVTRRITELLGCENVVVVGVRSMSEEEHHHASESGVNFISSYDVKKDGIDLCLKKVTNIIKPEKLYLSIDLDGVDPGFAPGVSTPEPFGLTPDDVKRIINLLGDRIIAADVVELTPPFDPSGITSALAARIVREIIAVAHLHRRKTGAHGSSQPIKPE